MIKAGWALALALFFALGFMLGSHQIKPKTKAPEPSRPEIRHAENSVTVRREARTRTNAEPSNAERSISVKVKTTLEEIPLEILILKERDGTKRVKITGPEGSRIEGQDWVLMPEEIPREKRWTIGAAYHSQEKWGAAVFYRKGRIQAGMLGFRHGAAAVIGFTF